MEKNNFFDEQHEGAGAVFWLLISFTVMVLFAFSIIICAQTYRLENPTQDAGNVFTFDVVVYSDTPVVISSYQAFFSFNKNIGLNLSFSYLPNTSDFNNIPTTSGIYDNTYLGFGSYVGSDTVYSRKRIGRFEIMSSNVFNVEYPNIRWEFIHPIYRTIILGDKLFNITNKGNYQNLVYEQPLPVELSDIDYMIENDSVYLIWTTITETNVYGFEVQVLGRDEWLPVTFIPGAGNSNSPKTYKVNITPNKKGEYYYRIKIIDLDNSFTFSNIVKFLYENEKNEPLIKTETYWKVLIVGFSVLALIYILVSATKGGIK